MSADSRRGVAPERVRERLRRVTDPELDRSIVALEYVDEVRVDGDRVTVRLTLPTAWCSPAFAWMMAVDARDEVEALSGVRKATVRLHEHMHQTEINEGVNGRRSFAESFPDAEDGVESVRRTLDRKARLSRQYVAVEALLDAGLTPEQVVNLTPADVRVGDGRSSGSDADGRSWGSDVDGRPAGDDDNHERPAGDENADGGDVAVSVRDGTVFVAVEPGPVERYLSKARETVGLSDDEPMFRDPDGAPMSADSFELVHRRTRSSHVNMSGQGGVCDALNEARRSKFGRDDG